MTSYPAHPHLGHIRREPPKRYVEITVLLLVIAAGLWCAVVASLTLVVPHYERSFRDRNVNLPELTVWAIASGHWAGLYWYVRPLFALLVGPGVVGLALSLP
jgi:type II secretory pathway component PulF